MTLQEAFRLPRGVKVWFKQQVYDFGYVGQTGSLVLYEEGEMNMQDAIAVDPADVEILGPHTT